MKPDNESYISIDEHGRMKLPPSLMSRYAIQPNSILRVDGLATGLSISRPRRLAKLYIEPTNQCNLGCRTCVRNSWNEDMGQMSDETFHRIISGLGHFLPPPAVFFGGFGEPLLHPKIIDMIKQVKALGSSVELITNGTLLTPEVSKALIGLGIDVLWVSLDGSRPESYADIRLGATLPQVLANLKSFQNLLYHGIEDDYYYLYPGSITQVGIVFVAMKRNIADLPAVINIGRQVGATRFMVTNVLPYTQEMTNEILYDRTLNNYGRLDLPRIDRNEITSQALSLAISNNMEVRWDNTSTGNVLGRCPFIETGAAAIGWDGGFSPCLPLMHSHTSYYQNHQRYSRQWLIGNLADKNLFDLWNNPEHLVFREHVLAFDFPPCTTCCSCLLFENNEEDCIGNTFPTCGGCLWAQGIVRCP